MTKYRLIFLLILCCLSVTLIGCGNDSAQGPSTSNDYTAITTAGFYKDVRMQPNGEFIARQKISEDEAKNSGTVFKVDFNDNKQLEKITAMYSGTPINTRWKDTADRGFTLSTVTIEYQDGYEKYNFKNSRMAPCRGFYNAYSIRYKLSDDKKQHKVAYLYNKQGEQAANNLGFAQMLFTYDNKNALTKVGYAGTNGERVITKNKEYETRFKYDKSKKPIEVANYGKDESLMVDVTGIAKVTYKLDNLGRTVEVRHYGSDEALKERNLSRPHIDNRDIVNISAGAITKYSYDENSLAPNKISFYGKDEQPVGIKSWGNIASLRFKYTNKGELAELSSYGTDDTPLPLDKESLGDNVVKIGYSYDDNGNLAKMTFYGKDDNMVVATKLKASEGHMKYDDKRRRTEEAYFGTGGDAIDIQDEGRTYHRKVYEYNDDDEVTQYIYYNKEGQEVARVTPSPDDENSATGSTTTSSNKSGNADLSSLIVAKNQYDQDISALAKDINAYLSSNPNFRNAGHLISRAETIEANISATKQQVNKAGITNNALRVKLLEVLDAEWGRVDGLLEGMNASKNGGSHTHGFKRGTDAAYRFDDVNAELNKML